MSHKLVRFALKEVYNTPLLVTEDSFRSIDNYLSRRNAEDFLFEQKEDDEEHRKKKPEMYGKVGVLEISGSLTYRPVISMCGAVGTSYQGLLSDANELVSAGAETLLMVVDSGGGSAYSCFSTARSLRKLADDNGVSLIAMVDGSACSAAYALAVVADEVVAHPDASVGSIGCLVSLCNDSKALANEGIERKFVSFPKDKVPLNDAGEFTEKFMARIEKSVKTLGEQFFKHVSEFSGISEEAILALDGQVFSAQEALDIGLINKIMTQDEFSNYLSNKIKEN